MIDISNFCDTDIVDILSRPVEFKLVINLKALDRSGVKCSNTNKSITETSTSFHKYRLSENGKTDTKITKSM